MAHKAASSERERLTANASRQQNWQRFGPYLSERQWGTVREDYSADGNCWGYLPHDHARSRAYRWGEDGLLGITDRQCRLCFAFALWNGADAFLKERLFGLGGPEGNHGEDVKEEYFYLDALPTAAFLQALYKYPQAAFPYERLVAENKARGRDQPEFELADTGAFEHGRYFDVLVTYAKADADDLIVQLTVHNRGPDAAVVHVLPQLWFRNTWAWGRSGEGYWPRGVIVADGDRRFVANGADLPSYALELDEPAGGKCRGVLATENETNMRRLFGSGDPLAFVKDAFHECVVKGNTIAVNPARTGSKVAWHCVYEIPAGASIEMRLRLRPSAQHGAPFGRHFDEVLAARRADADAFYGEILGAGADAEAAAIQRQAYAGLVWSKQFYHLDVRTWLAGDPSQPPPPKQRRQGRNADFAHLYNRDVISMPDKWEYPWYAAWDLAFHMIPFATIDPAFAKQQLLLLLREWYMAPNGQIPAYEFAFGDVNPPVHAWACWRVYKMTGTRGQRDHMFLQRAFHKLLLNFTWWVNRKDLHGKHVFGGGFLGLDNIGVFDRSQPLPTGGQLEQADGTAWMAFYCATMLSIAIELACHDPAYEDVASKFFEHFVAITHAMNTLGGTGLWDEADGFYYDQIHFGERSERLRIRSLVGLIPLCAVEVLPLSTIRRLPGFEKRLRWFLANERDLASHVSFGGDGEQASVLLAIPSRPQLERVLAYVLDEREFLSPHGLRSLSAVHREKPFVLEFDSQSYRVDYSPGESTTQMFGGNSNWRGPVWMPLNYLIIEALERYGRYYGDALQVECPKGSGRMCTLQQVADEFAARLTRLFRRGADGQRPFAGGDRRFAEDPHWRDLVLFHEYFHGDTGRGCGASHQTGWTALVARCFGEPRAAPPPGA
ncbi:MAG TPA: glucosidase [Planctomycetota bacterium]|nr:glucosidase [Planctomycetota bacterium]